MVTSARMSRSISQVPSIWSLEHARDTATCSSEEDPAHILAGLRLRNALHVSCASSSHTCPLRVTHFFSWFSPRAALSYLDEGSERERKSITKIRVPTFYFFFFFLFFFPPSPSLVGVNLKKINHRLSKPPKMLWISLSVKHRCKRRKN